METGLLPDCVSWVRADIDRLCAMKFPRLPGINFRKWYVLLPLGVLAVWLAVFTYRSIGREHAAADLRMMGFEAGSKSIFPVIRSNWRVAFSAKFFKDRKEWDSRVRLMSRTVKDLDAYGPTLVRFQPREVLLGFCNNLEDVSVLRDFSALERLDFYECPKVKDLQIVSEFVNLRELTFRTSPALRSLDIVKSGTKLRSLHISNCRALDDISALRHLTSLRSLYLTDVPAVKDTELLRGLVDLEELDLSGCQELSDLNGLHGLKRLRSVDLRNCLMVSTKSVTELRSALPNARIQFP
jgi:hypothetical protein